MTAEWYYGEGKEQKGPVTQEQLTELARKGVLTPQSLVWKEGLSGWVKASTVAGLFPSQTSAPVPPAMPPLPASGPPALDQFATGTPTSSPAPGTVPASSGASRLAVLILTIIGGLFTLVTDGCTSAATEGVAKFGENLSKFDNQYGNGSDTARLNKQAEDIRKAGKSGMMLGLLQAVLGIAGGIVAFRRYDSRAQVTIAGKQVKWLTLGGSAILVATVMSLHNICGGFTAGIMNLIAGGMALMRSRTLGTGP